MGIRPAARRFWLAGLALGLVLAGWGGWQAKRVWVDHRFEEVDAGRLYKSAAMPPDRLTEQVARHGIRTVVDLRRPGGGEAESPEEQAALDAEAAALARLGVRWVHIPSLQVPEPDSVDRFLAVMADPSTHPVLVHCHHGTGRAELYAALYRIEFLGWSPEQARRATRLVVWGSSFDLSRPKGAYLSAYRPRRADNPAGDWPGR